MAKEKIDMITLELINNLVFLIEKNYNGYSGLERFYKRYIVFNIFFSSVCFYLFELTIDSYNT